LSGLIRYQLIIKNKACRDDLAKSKVTIFYLERPNYVQSKTRKDILKMQYVELNLPDDIKGRVLQGAD